MGLEFIDRSLRTFGAVLLIFLPFGLFYLGIFPALAVFSGGVWAILNLIFISALVRSTVRPGGVDKRRALGLALFKFPLLYVSGYFLLQVRPFEPLYLLIGFVGLFGVIILKAVGRALVGVHDQQDDSNNARSLA